MVRSANVNWRIKICSFRECFGGRVADPLKNMFPDTSSPANCEDARDRLVLALSELCKTSSDHYAGIRRKDGVFLKRHHGDVAASSLMYNTIHKLQSALPHTLVGAFTAKPIKLRERQTIYRRPSSDLYQKIRHRVRTWRERSDSSTTISHHDEPFWVRIHSTDQVGFILAVVETAFNEGYNVLDVRMGKESPDTRSVYILATGYLNVQDEKRLVDSLQKHGKATRESPSADLQSLDTRGSVWRLKTIVANRPGMLAGILTVLALYNMRVLDIHFLRPINGDAYGVESRVRIKLTFEHDCESGQDNPPVANSALNDPEFALDFIAAEVTLLPGFYSVGPARLVRHSVGSNIHDLRISPMGCDPRTNPTDASGSR